MHSLQIEQINKTLASSLIDARLAYILNKFQDKALVTTSFGTTSALLLHFLSRVRPGFPIHFIDTGYLFEETIAYKEELTRLLDLNVITHRPALKEHEATLVSKLWESDPDACCATNKVAPLEKVKNEHNVWISGLLSYQNGFRSGLDIFQKRSDIFRFYPLIDWTQAQVDDYFDYFGLPKHPLEPLGFSSIGCTHCTVAGDGRSGRWSSSGKTECGLHR
ncbi:MAG: phosphoadenylyl-sulfate reductase [bacterium]|nr:phosphoadenylyl-sulfate reductase [bacterium]